MKQGIILHDAVAGYVGGAPGIGRATAFVKVVRMPKVIRDPTFGFTAFTHKNHISVRGVHASGEYGESFVKLPYALRHKLYVREKWAETCDEYGGPIIAFKSTNKAFYIGPKQEILGECTAAWDLHNYPACGNWSPAQQMSAKVAQQWILPVAVKVCRVQHLGKGEWIECITGKGSALTDNTLWRNYEDGDSWFEKSEDSWRSYVRAVLGARAWNDNVFVWFYRIELVKDGGTTIEQQL